MGLLSATLDLFEDESERDNRIIKSGTLRTTRGTGVVTAGVLSTMAALSVVNADIPFLDQLTVTQEFYGAIAIGFIWAITAAADSLARGIATKASGNAAGYAVALQEIARASDPRTGLRIIEPPLNVVLTSKPAAEENGWLVVASAMRDDELQFCCVQGNNVEWVFANDDSVMWTTAGV